jgi:hypothetical protein
MFRKASVLILLLIAAILTLYGCKTEPLVEESLHRISDGHPVPISFNNLDELLANMAIVKFNETDRFEREAGAMALRAIKDFFIPLHVPQGYTLTEISIPTDYWNRGRVTLYYADSSKSDIASFEWYKINCFHGCNCSICDGSIGDEVYFYHNINMSTAMWMQYRARINTEFTSSFTKQEIHGFTSGQPICAWELQGNAISVLIQSTGNVRIFDEDGYEIVGRATEHGWYARDSIEYHALCIESNETMNRVGYSWQINRDLPTYQYVFEPGIYTFYFEGIVGELLVRYFADHEIVSSIDHSAKLAEQSFTGFSLTVTPYNSYLTIH